MYMCAIQVFYVYVCNTGVLCICVQYRCSMYMCVIQVFYVYVCNTGVLCICV